MSLPLRTQDICDPGKKGYPLLEANRDTIETISRETYVYGTTEKHKLDVFRPPESSAEARKPPILVFFYGGGFTSGARTLPTTRNLVYANVGAFFAQRRILTVIADYRLVPEVTFPGGSEDVRDALCWVLENLAEGDRERVFVLAHSAGGIHAAGLLLQPSLLPESLRAALRGVILMGVPYEIQRGGPADFFTAAEAYYGGAKQIAHKQPLGQLRRADPAAVAALPPIRNIMAQREPRRISSAGKAFVELYIRKGGDIVSEVLEGHNHLSPILALSSGSGEQWAGKVVRWVLEKNFRLC